MVQESRAVSGQLEKVKPAYRQAGVKSEGYSWLIAHGSLPERSLNFYVGSLPYMAYFY